MIFLEKLNGVMDYKAYRLLLENLLEQGKTTGPKQSPEYLNYAKINLQRMARLEKTIELLPELKSRLARVGSNYIWLVLTEGWCGDASQNLPVIEAMAAENTKISLQLVLRDENPELMDVYLTNGARSIPKLICIEKESRHEIFTWGPRPKLLQELVMELKAKGVSKEEKGLVVQKWYNADKTLSMQAEFKELLSSLIS